MANGAKRTAVIFVHGQGDQSPMDDLLQLAYTIWETDPKAAGGAQLGNLISVPMEGAQDGDIRRLITDEINGRQFHFYQFYWAHLMVGNTISEVWRWLVRLLQRPKAEVPDALRLARSLFLAVIRLMAILAIMIAALTAAPLFNQPQAYGAIASNAYAILWAFVGLVTLWLLLQGRKALTGLVTMSAPIIVVGALFGVALPNLIPSGNHMLGAAPISPSEPTPAMRAKEEPWARRVITFTCLIDSNPERSSLKDYCAFRSQIRPPTCNCPPNDLACKLERRNQGACKILSWSDLLVALHRAAVGTTIFFALTIALLWGRGSPFLKNVMADSARYFSNEPHNVAQRDLVRARGVQLLETLHSSGQYDRIVVIAHSLGTVVAYGMLDHYWGMISRDLQPSKALLDQLEDAARDLNHARDIELTERLAAFRLAQRSLSRSFGRTFQARRRWVVSDLVTLGSPLTYAPLLIADSPGEFTAKTRKLLRLPVSPPAPVETVTEGHRTDYSFHGEWIGRATEHPPGSLWPSALFATTRWTNLYFTNNRLEGGDIVGGPVSPTFGRGILDVAIERRLYGRGFLHNEYWKWPGQTKASSWAPAGDTRSYCMPPYHIARLRQAANLFESEELEAQLLDPQFRA